MCLGIALSFFACAALLVGMQCSRFLDDFPNKKRKIVQGCGLAFAITGEAYVDFAEYLLKFESFENVGKSVPKKSI